jgi:hypothetical protein
MKQIGIWILKIIAAGIMLQTLYFKFSAAPESVYIFSTLGLEPYGRIGIAILELIASIAILVPATTGLGALLAIGLMAGAIFSHLGKLGIVVMDDGGQLFIYALLVFISSLILLWINLHQIKALLFKITKVKLILCFIMISSINSGNVMAQAISSQPKQELMSSTAFSSSQATASIGYQYHWQLGKKKGWEIGLGLRNTSAFSSKNEYITAPARLARSNTIPFLIVFADQLTQNWDTLEVQRPFVNALNLMTEIKYHFNRKFSVGFNIDLIGVSFGNSSSSILTTNAISKAEINTKPSKFNLLLTGDLDKGSLDSEFFINYQLSKRWGIRAVYQYLFTEFTTTSIYQNAPDGTTVYQFRNKANNLGIGLSYNF